MGGDHGDRSDGDNGLLHIGARRYDPAIGRRISSDGYLGEVANPLSRNRHAYCEGDPVNAADPSGQKRSAPYAWKWITGKAVGTAAA